LKNARGKNMKYCHNNKKPVSFVFNEFEKEKTETLKNTVDSFLSKCREENGCPGGCAYHVDIKQSDFKELFMSSEIQKILKDRKIGKFVLLDQYGFKHIDDAVFKQLVGFPKTDFIFFISTSNISRFKEQECVKKYFEIERIYFDEGKPMECHSIMADYFRRFAGDDYYIHHFTIRKGSNYWGLIFGTGHSYGMEKFLKVCWRQDPNSGESNFNKNNDLDLNDLFYNPEHTIKKVEIKRAVETAIINCKICDNISGFEFVMKMGGEPKLFTDVVKQMEGDSRIVREGNLNYSSTNIHALKKKQYKIKVI